MQARSAGNHLLNGSNPFQTGPRRPEVPSYTPGSMLGSGHPTTSPESFWMPQSMQQQQQHTSLPPSPYYLPTTETGEFGMLPPVPSLSNPNTPNEILVGYAAPPHKSLASPSAIFESPAKGYLTEFELTYHDQALGSLFGNHDGFEPNTPSLATEMSFATDEMTPASMRMSASVEPSRS